MAAQDVSKCLAPQTVETATKSRNLHDFVLVSVRAEHVPVPGIVGKGNATAADQPA
jgi:hypothetical protein